MKTSLSLTALSCALALSLAGCADMNWTKPGADNAAVSRDLDDCRGRSLRGAPPAAAVVTQDPQRVERGAAPTGTRPAGSANERFIAEHDAVRECMAAKGYRLTPAP